MRKLTLTIAMASGLTLSACSSETSGTFEGEDGETGEYTIDRSTGETSATIETDEGTVSMRAGKDVPVDLPGGFTVYPGAEIISNTVVAQNEGKGTIINMQSDDSPDDIAAFYKSQAEKAGVEIQMELTANGSKTLGGESKDGLTFSVIASGQGEGTVVNLTVGTAMN